MSTGRPLGLRTKIFLDGGDPQQTKAALDMLGFLDGQTTNPTLIAKNPVVQDYLAKGAKYTEETAYELYRKVVTEISALLPEGSVSIEVYADQRTPAKTMISQAEEMFAWIPNAHIKFPITAEGLRAAELAVKAHVRVNLTLCFSQPQAAAVYQATRGAKRGDVFISPFVGRLDDRGENGMDLIKNILQMYRPGDGHVEVLAASIRTMEHFLCALQMGVDIATVPFKILNDWAARGMPIPGDDFVYRAAGLRPIPYQNLSLTRWQKFDIGHELTDKGIEKFSQDWNALIQ
ncbi:MAG: transaldolase family protein [Patescibacteria group bacterium]|nr:transaldolase family protein [Patescibacteria group bacterium]